MTIIGACIYAWGGEVETKIRLLQPHHVVVGSGIWNDLPAIIAACPPYTQFILRDMRDNLIDLPVYEVLGPMLSVVGRHPGSKFIAHGLNESYSDAPRAALWEWRFVEKAHEYGLKTVCLNLAYGNDPSNVLKAVADVSDYIGAHGYDGWIENEQKWVDRIYTSRRYETNWLKDYRHKIIMTEVGIESFPGTGQRRGWRDMNIPEDTVRLRMLANAMHWKADGLLGVCWFTAGHTESSWNDGYGMTEAMAKSWGNKDAPSPPVPVEPPTNGGEELATAKELFEAIEKAGEKAHELLIAGKQPSQSYTELGGNLVNIDTAYDVIGDIINKAREGKKVLETPIPV